MDVTLTIIVYVFIIGYFLAIILLVVVGDTRDNNVMWVTGWSMLGVAIVAVVVAVGAVKMYETQ